MKFFILLLLSLSILLADYGGGYAGSEFRYASNARDLALAGANLADGSDGYFQFSNPAQLPQLKSVGIFSSLMSARSRNISFPCASLSTTIRRVEPRRAWVGDSTVM